MGGYYASREEGNAEFSVFRLLDFNRHVYHIAIFKEKFAEIPSLEEVIQIAPYIGHAPIDSRALLRSREIHLLGGPPLSADDLDGYRFYLEHYEMNERDIEELFGNVLAFCGEPPMKLTLSIQDDELQIEERE